MKKATSFLLALVMLVGMLPGTVVPAAAAAGTLEAYYTYAEMTADGKLDEDKWLLKDKIGSTPVMLLCNEDSLFVGLQTAEKAAEFTIEGKTVKVDLSAGTVMVDGVSVGTAAVDAAKGVAEVQIKLAGLGMDYNPKQSLDFAAKIGSDSFSGKLTFAHKAMLMVDDFTNTKDKTYASSMNKVNDEVYVVEENGSLHYQTNNMTDKGTDARIGWMTARFAQGLDLTKGMEVVLNVDFNDLIVPAADMQAYWGVTGFAVYNLVGNLWGHGFTADAEGNIYVAQYEEAHPWAKKFDTGLDLPAKNVNIRIVITDDFTAEIYVNGKNVGNFDTTSRKGTTDSGNASMYIWASTGRRDLTATRKNDVLLHDMYITQEAPAAKLTAPAVGQGMVAVDGVPGESFWTMNGKVGETRFGALADEENLYIALDSKESSVGFTFGDAKATAKLGKAPKFELGFTMGSEMKGNGKGQYEIMIPLRLLQQTAPNGQNMPFGVTSGDSSRSFLMTLGGNVPMTQTVYAPAAGDGKNDAVAYLDVAGLKLDGAIKDLQWYTPYKATGTAGPGAEFGFQWDATNLYLGGQIFTTSRADKVELTIGDKTMTADLIAEKVPAGKLYVAGQTMEWAIPLKELGLSGLGAKTTYEIKVTNADGTSKLYGDLSLSGVSVVLGDTATDLTTKDYTFRYTPAEATWKQADGYQKLYVDPSQKDTTVSYEHYALPKLNGAAYDLSVDLQVNALPSITGSYAWRGLCWEIRQEHLQARFALRDDGKGSIMMDALYLNATESIDTGKDLGDRFTFTISVDKDNVPTLYIDGEKVHTFQKLDRTTFTIVDSIPMPQLRCDLTYSYVGPNAAGEFLGIDANIYNTLWTQSSYADNAAVVNTALDQLNEEDVLAGSDPKDVTKLSLLKQVYFSENGITVPIIWKAVDKATGQVTPNVNTDTGVVTKSAKPLSFELTATASYGGSSATKSFTFETKGKATGGKVALIVHDENPKTGTATDFTVDSYEYFDTTHNSLVVDQGSSKAFNRIVLHDMDEYSRVAQRHLGVFVSNDGKNYTKVNGWLLHQDGKEYTLYNLNETARYVKVHTYHDDLDMTGEVASFYNTIQSMITVSNESNLPGANGAFAHKAEVKVTTGEKDSPVFISIASLGAKAGQYKADASDFRFTADGKMLAHWYNGKDGFYVRVNAVPATITAQWGCSSAKDFSDPEAVFEVTYGNVSLINLSKATYEVMGSYDAIDSHARPFTFPNGDVIVAARRDGTDADVAIYRSTDGGRTFTTRPVLAYDESRDSRPDDKQVRGSGFGGYMWDEELQRLYVIAYSGDAYNPSTDYRLCLTYTDDYGYTWSEVRFITNPVMPKVKENDYILQNAPHAGATRAILYCDGLKMRDADGAGPNVDYVIVHALADRTNGRNITTAIYSKDGGNTWIGSDTLMQMDIPSEGPIWLNGVESYNSENGLSESGFAQLDDGSLYVVMRAQQKGNFYLWEGRSYDFGKTWKADYSKIISSNTSPVLAKYGEDRLILHSSRNSIGMNAFRRTPMHIGLSSDNYQSFDRYLDLTFGTAFDSVQDLQLRMTQPGMGISADGKEIFVSWYDHTYKDAGYPVDTSAGFLVEEFDQMIYNTKGGYDDFEDASLKYQGWLNDLAGKIELTREASASGLQSMKVVDANSNAPTHAVRQVPAMKAGTVGAKVMAPADNKSTFAMELKAAYNFVHLRHTLAAVSIAGDGTVSLCYKTGSKAVAKVEPGTWNDIALSFDIAKGMGKLTVNGKVVADDVKLMTDQEMNLWMGGDKYVSRTDQGVVREITAVEFNQIEATQANGDCLYVDDFYATELTSALDRAADNISFADVTKGDWYYDAVSFAVANGIMSGYNADKFGPNDTLNRAMVVQVLYNKEGQPALNGLKHSFSDVPTSQWFNNAVTWGSNRGVVSGFGGGLFKPEDAVTIEQVAVILWNYTNTPAGSGDLSKVGSHSDWAANALKWAVEKGILNNVPFRNATEKATRAQTAQMLTNYLRNI
ncbi:MAG: S-layer homology domain-containing protein [Oscillospiraceae bacterium]|nr:S-layer homology domain-containing protein [Oscillospiraceae bacterium]